MPSDSVLPTTDLTAAGVLAPLQRAVAVVDRLRSPQGCPWDMEQTHRSLVRYLLEESFETAEAIETDDAALLREELGDLLLQVLLHARIAQEADGVESFCIDDVATDLAEKMIRRHPHVFGDVVAADADAVVANWEELKAAEKSRTSVTDGVPLAQPALALAGKLVSRAQRAGIDSGTDPEASSQADQIGARLFAVVRDAVREGIEPESALRNYVRAYRAALLETEKQAVDGHGGTEK